MTMPPSKKRKSEGAPLAEEGSSPKKIATTPATGEKRKRGRPRKYPEGTGPKPPPGPKRGRGRPRKDPSAKDTTSKPKTPQEGKRPVGRPRKLPQNGADASSSGKSKTASTVAKAEEYVGHDPSDRSYWLMKAEPESRIDKGVDVKFSIDDLRERSMPEPWDGIRNPAARNHLRDMKKGDLAFFYHSNCKVPGVAGIMEIVREHTPDESAFDPAHPYYDEKSKRDNPKWDVVHVEFRRKFKDLVTLNDIKSHAKPGAALENLQMVKQSRLSVSRVSKKEWDFILRLAKEENESEPQTEDSSKDDGSAGDESSE